MGMAREGLQVLNQLVQALIKGDPEGAGADEQLQTFSALIDRARTEFRLCGDAVDPELLAGALLELHRVLNQFEVIDESENVVLTKMRMFLDEIAAGLEQPASANLEKVCSTQAQAREAFEEELKHIQERVDLVSSHSELTALYRKRFDSQEQRKEKAAEFQALGARLMKVAAGGDLTTALEQLIERTYASVRALNTSAAESADFEDALKNVLITAGKLRNAGFKDASLDELIAGSVVALVAAQTGQIALVEKAERGLVDRLMGTSRRRSEKALVAAFEEDYVLGQAAQLVSKYFDVNVLSREETCKIRLAELSEEMAKIYLSEGMEGAKRFEASIQGWVREGMRYGLKEELPRVADIVVPALLGKNFLGPKEWNAQGIYVGTPPPLPSSITEALLNSYCPLHHGEKIKDTHVLVLVPKTVNGRPYTALELDKLCAERKGSGDKLIYRGADFANTWKKCGWAKAAQVKSEWVLMPKSDPDPFVSPVKHFRRKNIAEQQKVHDDHYREYRQVKAREVMTLALLYDLVNKERLLPDQLRCEEPNASGGEVCVGDFDAHGLLVRVCWDGNVNAYIGRALARKL
jgi:hypothetical protein